MYFRDAKPSNVVKLPAGTGGVTIGDLVVVSANTVIKATDAPSAVVMGIALETALVTVLAAIETFGRIITAKYTGVSKTSVTDADLLKTFDLSTEAIVDLDDTTGGPCLCVGYNNTKSTIDFILPLAARIV